MNVYGGLWRRGIRGRDEGESTGYRGLKRVEVLCMYTYYESHQTLFEKGGRDRGISI
jgi:hypothetical protein